MTGVLHYTRQNDKWGFVLNVNDIMELRISLSPSPRLKVWHHRRCLLGVHVVSLGGHWTHTFQGYVMLCAADQIGC